MRTDMKKVLTERPRHGHAKCYGEIRTKHTSGDLETLPQYEGMRTPYTGRYGGYGDEAKQFSDLLGPLRRFMHSCIGRRWDDVWSEICSQLSNNTVDAHLKGHVTGFIEIDTVMIDNEVYERSRYLGYIEVSGLYVHPITGLICEAERISPKREPRVSRDGFSYYVGDNGVLYPTGWAKTDHPRKIIGPEKEAVQIDGIWYWVVFADYQRPQWGSLSLYRCSDAVTGKLVESGRYRIGKRQMSKVDMRRHGLVNDLSLAGKSKVCCY